MKLGPEHIGKKVRAKGDVESVYFPATVISVDDGFVWVRTRGGSRYTYAPEIDWELVEEPKRPSERINEIVDRHRALGISQEIVVAIITYLDEQWEKK